jgi:hypothetical protein
MMDLSWNLHPDRRRHICQAPRKVIWLNSFELPKAAALDGTAAIWAASL